ncbi:MAG: hypothetical protein Q9216_001951 [Gyalolechia sp. 2 TL-2023]
MGRRPTADDFEDEAPRRRGRREDHHDDFEEIADEPEFEEEVEQRPPRRKAAHRRKPRRVEEDEEGEEEEEDSDDDHHGKQLVVRSQKKKKSSGKEVARRKKREPSEEEDSSEEEKKTKKKAKKKSKARKEEVVTKAAWEPVPRDEMDLDFIGFISDELGHHQDKIWECLEDDLILRHTETGEYNIDACFDEGNFSMKDKKQWKRAVSKLKTSTNRDGVLFCSATAHSAAPGYGSSYGPGRAARGARAHMPAVTARGHRRYHPYCRDCEECGEGCAILFAGYGGY